MVATHELFHSYMGEAMTANFEVFPLPEEEVKKRKYTKRPKRERGRPKLYNGTQRRQVASALKKYGLTKGLKWLALNRNLKVSITLARNVAEEYGITFAKGRHTKAA